MVINKLSWAAWRKFQWSLLDDHWSFFTSRTVCFLPYCPHSQNLGIKIWGSLKLKSLISIDTNSHRLRLYRKLWKIFQTLKKYRDFQVWLPTKHLNRRASPLSESCLVWEIQQSLIASWDIYTFSSPDCTTRPLIPCYLSVITSTGYTPSLRLQHCHSYCMLLPVLQALTMTLPFIGYYLYYRPSFWHS